MRRLRPLAVPCVLAAAAGAQHDAEAPAPAPAPLAIAGASDEAQQQIAKFTLAPGLQCDLLAAEPDLCNAVAFAIDGRGRVYVAETFRINDGVFDTRNYMQWKDADLACRTVADRVAKYGKFIPDDVPKYAAFPERIRLLVDSDKNGSLDRSTVFADAFTELADGIASGVLPVGDDVFFTNIPKLWRLRDRDGDGTADERHVVHDGYGVHTSLIGHDLHGLVVGPDRRLYFSIGDRGFHVEHEGRVHTYPDEGAVLRCELDGSDLEVVHRGLRNPQELAFDQWGDLFTGDNNSDGGDRARFVQVVAGADSGWRIGYQWLDDRGAWNREQLWQPRHPGQPAWHLPPIANIADGPSGLAYDPGQGLPARYRDCFFLCDFRGGSSYSGVHALRLQRHGAGFALVSWQKPIWGVLCTDVDFAPDGSMYVLDWVSGWNKTGKARIYRVRTPAMANDLALRGTAQLLAGDLKARGEAQLGSLLAHADRRVRQAAQFALVDLGAIAALQELAAAPDAALPRLHAIWGLGILGRRDAAALATVPALLDDGDADVRTAAARVLGDARLASAGPALVKGLADRAGGVQRECALALARLGPAAPTGAAAALLGLLRRNDDRDHVLRHAAVFALAEVADTGALQAHTGDSSRAVRLGVLLALARRRDAAIATFLTDGEPALRFEAARAIYELPIDGAMAALAQLAYDDVPDQVATDWRVLNANRMRGEVESGETLVHTAGLASHPTATRREALAILAEWLAPHGQCRVTGVWRPCEHPKAEIVARAFAPNVPTLLADDEVAAATAAAAARLGLRDTAPALAAAVTDDRRLVDIRIAALDALDRLQAPELPAATATIGADAPVALRRRAVELLSRSAPEQAVPVLATLLANAPTGERQAALQALGDLRHPSATALLGDWLARLPRGEVPAPLQLDLLLAAARHESPDLARQLAAHDTAAAAEGALGPWSTCREGGDAKAGKSVFFDHEATRCTRCHTLDGQGGNAGPVLDGIGKRLDRDQLLAALVTPSAAIAAGFGSTTVDLHDGTVLAGFVTKDQDGVLTLVGVDGKAQDVPWSRIQKRTPNGTSAMPPMGGPLDRRQIRDLIEFLATRK
jgi:quinoprotein glucose dehydrogenase